MTDLRDWIRRLAREEDEFFARRFLAPRARRSRVRVRIAGFVHGFAVEPEGFEGWGLFEPVSPSRARVEGLAEERDVRRWLALFSVARLTLVRRLTGKTWLAQPRNRAEAQARWGSEGPFSIHLVREASAFDGVLARFDGASFWFEDLDPRADPRSADRLRGAFADRIALDELDPKGLTPEELRAYALARGELRPKERSGREGAHESPEDRDRARLERALTLGGGALRDFRDRDLHWVVHWVDRGGRLHTSAISKDQLTVMSAGICLDGGDRAFDLESLVGVVEGAHDFD